MFNFHPDTIEVIKIASFYFAVLIVASGAITYLLYLYEKHRDNAMGREEIDQDLDYIDQALNQYHN